MKWRLFRHLYGGNDHDAERVYRWHIEERSGHRIRAGLTIDQWKRSLDDYVETAKRLLGSMMMIGFATEDAVPVDPRNELLDGSHRVACALALGIETIPVMPKSRPVWAPAWDLAWFMAHGMKMGDIERLKADWGLMKA